MAKERSPLLTLAKSPLAPRSPFTRFTRRGRARVPRSGGGASERQGCRGGGGRGPQREVRSRAPWREREAKPRVAAAQRKTRSISHGGGGGHKLSPHAGQDPCTEVKRTWRGASKPLRCRQLLFSVVLLSLMDVEEETRTETDSEEEEDEELMMLIFPALLRATSSRSKVPCYTSKLSGAEYTSELLEGHQSRCRHNLRMEARIFKALADYLSSRELLDTTRGVTVEEQLAIFMYMLARNASFTALCDRFQHSGETIHRHIAACFNAISSLAFDFVKPPSNETHWKILSNPHFAAYFQNCLGVIDGTHVPVTMKESEAAPYRNRKHTLSQNVMVACDFDLNFVYVSSGWEGSASDAGVLNSAIRSGFRVPAGKYYLVDGGYANMPGFLAPYRGVRYHLKKQGRGNSRPRDYKELFNLRHALLRNHIERAIGVLKMRFPILKVATHYPIESQVKIPIAAVVLHNIIRSHKGDEDWLSSQEPLIDPRKYVVLPSDSEMYREDATQLSSQLNSQRNEANAMRDEIAKRMWTDYERNRRRRRSRRTS